jgi:tetratricopeptide (TPR) repeat protein
MQLASFARAARALALAAWLAALGCRGETENLFAEAAKAEQADDYEGAARRLREVAIGDPESPLAPKALLELARIHLLRTRDVTAAHATLAEILDKYPESDSASTAHRLLGRLYEHDRKEPENAIRHYRASLEKGLGVADERETLLSLGECHYQQGELDEAEAVYRRAAALPYDDTTDSALFRLSTLSRLAGDHESELQWLEEIAARSRDGARRHLALLLQVEALLDLARFEDARARLKEAERLLPGAPEIREIAGRVETAQATRAPMGEESARILELQEKIPWGSRRAPRRER